VSVAFEQEVELLPCGCESDVESGLALEWPTVMQMQ